MHTDFTSREALQKYTRQFPTAKEGAIIRLGLSPWSRVHQCDLCASVKPYMDKHGIDHEAPLVQIGRWMFHEDCQREAGRDHLGTLMLPRLNYAPLESLPAPARIAVMKIQLQKQAEEALNDVRARA